MDPVSSSGECELYRIKGVRSGDLRTEGKDDAMEDAADRIARQSDGGFGVSQLLVGRRMMQPLCR